MPAATPNRTLVLGVGNLLLSDEGIGVRVIERLQELYHIPQEVQVVDGGTLGLDLLYYLEGVERLLMIDAVDAGLEPGTVRRYENQEVPAFLSLKMSPHQVGITDMLVAARLRDLYPQHLVLWGVQPASLDISLALSPVVAAQLDFLVAEVRTELERWGVVLTPHHAPTADNPD